MTLEEGNLSSLYYVALFIVFDIDLSTCKFLIFWQNIYIWIFSGEGYQLVTKCDEKESNKPKIIYARPLIYISFGYRILLFGSWKNWGKIVLLESKPKLYIFLTLTEKKNKLVCIPSRFTKFILIIWSPNETHKFMQIYFKAKYIPTTYNVKWKSSILVELHFQTFRKFF